MAAIHFGPEAAWVVPGWVYRTTVRLLDEQLPPNDAMHALLAQSVEPYLEFLDVTTVSDADRALLTTAAKKARDRVVETGPGGWANMEAHAAFLDHLRDLVVLLETGIPGNSGA